MASVTLKNCFGSEVTVSAEAAEGMLRGGWTRVQPVRAPAARTRKTATKTKTKTETAE